MTRIRVGTRGSDLARRQTQWVCDRLIETHREIEIETIVIRTHGDVHPDQPMDDSWPPGGFVGAIERALIAGEIDFAVHSYKDLPTTPTPGLSIAAVPPRAVAHDVLITRQPVDWRSLPPGFRIGTGSPRRAAQLRYRGDVVIVPIRGNVPTRVDKLQTEDIDGVVLAAAGLDRLGMRPDHMVDLPVEEFVPAAGQGALAVQTREGDAVAKLIAYTDDPIARRCVDAERSFLRAVDAGCQAAAGALAVATGDAISLRGQLFSSDGSRRVDYVVSGGDPIDLGQGLGVRLVRELRDAVGT